MYSLRPPRRPSIAFDQQLVDGRGLELARHLDDDAIGNIGRRPAVEPALAQSNAEILQRLMLLLALDHFRDGHDAEAVAGREHALDDGALARLFRYAAHITAVDLDVA